MYNIAYITDDNYAIPTRTSINSMVKNITEIEICINVVAVEVSEENQSLLKSLECEKVKINILNFSNDYKNLGLDHATVSKAALFKFQLPNIFADFDSILYIDGDTIVKKGFHEIFNVNISDVYAAVVMDMHSMVLGKWHERLGHKHYFNSGMMYLNLKKMRNDHIPEKLIEYKKNDTENHFMDQNAFNAVFNERIIYLNPKYNHIDDLNRLFDVPFIASFFGVPERDIRNPLLRHMAGGEKPWKSVVADNVDEWISSVNSEDSLKVAKNYCVSLINEFTLQFSKLQEKYAEQEIRISELEVRNRELYNLIVNTRHRTLYGVCAWLFYKIFKKKG